MKINRVDEFLVDFVLHTACKGNKSELARRLELDPKYFHDMLKDMRKGKISMAIMLPLLTLILHDESIDLELLRERFRDLPLVSDGACHYSKLLDQVAKKYRSLASAKEETDMLHALYRVAENFMEQVRICCCSNFCRFQYEDEACPCKRFVDYMTMLSSDFEKR